MLDLNISNSFCTGWDPVVNAHLAHICFAFLVLFTSKMAQEKWSDNHCNQADTQLSTLLPHTHTHKQNTHTQMTPATGPCARWYYYHHHHDQSTDQCVRWWHHHHHQWGSDLCVTWYISIITTTITTTTTTITTNQ